MTGECVVEWGVKRSLVDYMRAAGDFAVETAGGATFDVAEGARIPAMRDAEGSVRMGGAVILRAHQGMLEVPIVDGEIAGGALTIADPAGEPGDRMALVTLAPLPAGPGLERWEARLSEEADAMFRFSYVPRALFDEVVVRG